MVSCEQRQLRPKDWDEVTLQLNNEVTDTFTTEQVRNRIDTLRKNYKKEKSKTITIGGVRSTWEYFEVVDTLWSSTPRCVGIPGAFDSASSQSTHAGSQGTQQGDGCNDGEDEGEGEIGGETGGEGRGEGETIVEETASVVGAVDAGDATRIPQVDNLPGVKAQKVKEPKRTSLGSIAKVLEERMKGMAQTMKDREKERAAQEERLLKLRMDDEARRMEMYIKFQMDLAKIVTKPKEMLVRTHLETPSGRQLAKIIEDFQDITNLPNMCGAVDGTHIKLARKPHGDFFPTQYVSRHGFHIILLQGIVDSRKIFWNVVCSAPGGTHDSTVFKGFAIYAQMKRNEVLNTPLLEVSGLRVRPYIVEDSVYKPSSFLVKAYKSKGGQDLPQKNVFDRHIAKGRIKGFPSFFLLPGRLPSLTSLPPSQIGFEIACSQVEVFRLQYKQWDEPWQLEEKTDKTALCKGYTLHPIPKSYTEIMDFNAFMSESSSLYTAHESELLYLTWRSLPKHGIPSSMPEGFCQFIDTIICPITTPSFIATETIKQRNVWMGSLVTSRIHFDALDNLHVCLSGKKIVHLYPPSELPNLYPEPWNKGLLNNFSQIGSAILSNQREHPRYFSCKRFRVELNAGEAIFIPVGWWHEDGFRLESNPALTLLFSSEK
ncbi:hypothetical protein GOP47_0017471 [Adiantum capillus-veneris]|uniref:JmjC domain-containing protein n=1 Tax=Adiantum capillus-veneris TaxID=13818 RepID=A0A9D4UFD8_ADICA|nr:hypothetical protein GOP47_0017471 [Adiantum capillus-veneris]